MFHYFLFTIFFMCCSNIFKDRDKFVNDTTNSRDNRESGVRREAMDKVEISFSIDNPNKVQIYLLGDKSGIFLGPLNSTKKVFCDKSKKYRFRASDKNYIVEPEELDLLSNNEKYIVKKIDKKKSKIEENSFSIKFSSNGKVIKPSLVELERDRGSFIIEGKAIPIKPSKTKFSWTNIDPIPKEPKDSFKERVVIRTLIGDDDIRKEFDSICMGSRKKMNSKEKSVFSTSEALIFVKDKLLNRED